MATRLQSDQRKDAIITMAMRLAERDGFFKLSKRLIAKEAGVSHGLISHYFNIDELHNEVMKRAIKSKNLTLIAQGIISNNEIARRAPARLKAAALKSIA